MENFKSYKNRLIKKLQRQAVRNTRWGGMHKYKRDIETMNTDKQVLNWIHGVKVKS